MEVRTTLKGNLTVRRELPENEKNARDRDSIFVVPVVVEREHGSLEIQVQRDFGFKNGDRIEFKRDELELLISLFPKTRADYARD